MAKSGLNAMTVALADALGPKVRVNCILPGAILTDISKAWSEETIANAHKTPIGRAGYAEDFPGAALFFASQASAWITGTCLRVDGGDGPPARALTDGAGRLRRVRAVRRQRQRVRAALRRAADRAARVRRRRRRPPAQRAGLGLDAARARVPPRRGPERPHVGHRRARPRPSARVHRPARATATPTAAATASSTSTTTPPTSPSPSAPWRRTRRPSSACRSAA